ncbi:hypothetical protein J4468_03825 [Candidatus Woesearchaeota archaeon]|nr:hypothetical protein [Candidatus Woesearchaeota archaeon]
MAEKINSIIWDLGGVVYTFDQGLADNEFARLSRLDPKIVADLLYGQTVQSREYNDGFSGSFNLGAMTPQEFYKVTTEALNIRIGYEEFTQIWSGIFTVNEKVRDFIIELHDRHISQATLSSTDPMHLNAMNGLFNLKTLLGEKNVFATFHADAGYKKPTKELFDAFFNRTGFEKSESVYVDDVQKYLKAAEIYGIGATVHVNLNNSQFQKECINDVRRLLGL